MTNSEELYHYAEGEGAAANAAAEYELFMQEQEQHEQAKAAELILSTDCTKDAIATQVRYLTHQVREGHVNALLAGVHISAVEKVCKEVREAIKSDVITEVAKHGKTAQVYGTEVQIKEAGVQYDFSHCNDVVYNALTLQLEELKAKIKAREGFLKTIVGTQTLVDNATGEVYTVNPPIKSSTTTYSVTHK